MSDTSTILLAIVGTGISLLTVLVPLLVFLFRWLRQDVQALRQEVRQDIRDVNSRIDVVNSRIDSFFNRPPTAA